jgi:hypothetical protein
MFRPLARSHRRPPRRGTSFVLIVVVMISFAAAVGVAFALFAGQALRQAQAHKQAAGGGGTPVPRAPEPTGTLNKFLSALVFDVDVPDGSNVLATNEAATNALRGHSIARSMYGGQIGNATPWAGVGPFSESMADPGGTAGGAPYAGMGLSGNRSTAVNFTQMAFNNIPLLLDPEYTGHRGTAADTKSGVYVGKHAGYSYPDTKDFFLGALDPATGQVVTPSFHRDWVFGALDPTNPNWTNTGGRLLTLRPRPGQPAVPEHPKFPRVPPNADGTYTGDVQNLSGGYYYDAGTQQYVARNDSLWMHIGLPTVPFGNRRVQPLVAPLILPLDAVLNATAHGNNFGTAPGQNHAGYTGYGPSEVNLGAVLSPDQYDTNGNLTQRGGRWTLVSSRGVIGGTRAYDPYRSPPAPQPPTPLPGYAPVAWSGTPVATPLQYPVGNTSTLGGPNYGAGFDSTNAPVANYPELRNAANIAANSRVPFSDLKRLHLRYAFTPDWVEKAFLVTNTKVNAPTDLLYDATAGGGREFTFDTRRTTYHGYRTNLAHANRMLLAPQAYALDRPKLAPNFQNGGGLAMNLPAPQPPTATSRPGPITPGTFPSPGPLGAYSDFQAQNMWVSKMAALGSVNLNRPLADYRTDTTKPLGPGNASSNGPADQDRRKLAHDIFVRLAVATGAALPGVITTQGVDYPNYQYGTGGPNGFIPLPGNGMGQTPPAQYNALRYLAQLAVNIVDYRDDDDISTAFVWNPIPPNTVSRPRGGTPNNVGGADDPENFADDQIDNRVVFGVERRLSLNEVYSEITNRPSDPPNGKDEDNDGKGPDPLPAGRLAQVKFFAELVNPLQGGSAIPLSGYRIEIARGAAPTPPAGMPDPGANLPLFSRLYAADNVTGDLSPLAVADALCDLDNPTNPGAPTQVGPSGGAYSGGAAGGFVLVAPPLPPAGQGQGGAEFQTPPAAGKWTNANTVRSQQLAQAGGSRGSGYEMPMPGAGGVAFDPQSREFRRHVVLLRRKANPYVAGPGAGQPINTNPHITVDIMDYVPSFDALARNVGMTTSRPERNAMNMSGYDPMDERYSVGKVQPNAAYAQLSNAANPANQADPVDGPGNYNRYAFPYSMVLNQVTSSAMMGAPATEPRNTFGRHNGSNAAGPAAGSFTAGTPATLAGGETLMTPFDWYIHLDRPLVNALELFPVRDSTPHLVTQRFLSATNANPGVSYANGYADWTSVNGIGRALELLTVKPFASQAAHGGRTASPLNLNAVRDQRVVNALFDPQAGNSFTQAFVDGTAWGQWMASRKALTTLQRADGGTVGGAQPPGQPLHLGGTQDDPFMPFGTPAVLANGGFAFAGSQPNGMDRTILRSVGNAAPLLPGGAAPVLFTTTAANQQYIAAEPVRKIANNVTTVSHTYVVYLTVGYFEIDLETLNPVTGKRDGLLHLSGQANGPTMSRLAHEAYLAVPGDMRQKFIAMVDTSAMAMEPGSNALKGDPSTPQTAALPFFAELTRTPQPITDSSGAPASDPVTGMPLTKLTLTTTSPVDVNGNPTNMADGSQLVIGYGVEQQVVQVVANLPPGVALGAGEVAVIRPTPAPGPMTPPAAPAPALNWTPFVGTVVSNARPGYPGPQPGFDYTAPRFKAVVPYAERVK